MTARRMEGKTLAAEIRAQVTADAARIARRGFPPTLALLQAGSNEAVAAFSRSIARQATNVGIDCRQDLCGDDVTQEQLLRELHSLNEFMGVDAILVLFPLPPHIDARAVAEAIDPCKDIEGISPINVGRLALNEPVFVPNTPLGGMDLLRHYGVTVRGAEAVVVGRSAIVGKPMALMLLQEHATVTICHTRTRDLAAVTRRADILVVAAGHPGLITAEMIKPGATVIDFGTTVTETGVTGDVEFEAAMAVAGLITPVPGGTGPVTTAVLFRSVIQACGI